MNKKITFLLSAIAALASCTKDAELLDVLPKGETEDNTPVAIRLGWHSVSIETRSAIEGSTLETDELGVFMLATGKQPENPLAAEPSWLEESGAWMDNQKAKASLEGITFPKDDGTADSTCYYPLDSRYRYNFFAYYPYSEDVMETENSRTVRFTLDGTQDIIWGKSEMPADARAGYAYSARYYRLGGSETPQLRFVHKLMRLQFALAGYNPTDDPGYNEYTKVTLKELWIKNVPVEAQLDVASGDLSVDWSSPDKDTLYVRDSDESLLEPVAISGLEPQLIGQKIMLPVPEGDTKFTLGMCFSCEGETGVTYLVEKELDMTGFVAGHGYKINIRVPGMEAIPNVIVIEEEEPVN